LGGIAPESSWNLGIVADAQAMRWFPEADPDYIENSIISRRIGEGSMGIGQRLKEARTKSAMRQVDLACLTGVGLRTIRQIEQTDFEPRLATARKLATALGVHVEWLVFGIEPMTETPSIEEETWS
jgi:DNA-binding XRE family transcriptional regulator